MLNVGVRWFGRWWSLADNGRLHSADCILEFGDKIEIVEQPGMMVARMSEFVGLAEPWMIRVVVLWEDVRVDVRVWLHNNLCVRVFFSPLFTRSVTS